ncbi:hypothetical protein PTTG_29531 [Puccinia triticina 1-1 BBBD Race 1]|uniref:Uncharacterized protein n=1 Tax=Puccinia triticina (isolate 1-1 / race 1 (BBBD)) TaxID=630390 RepID=A0A180G410_PUCT1|nr:hypothetical protein PTTG_29531 [Puccinia triticina 1-1 BBBD Race 1]
MHTVKLSASSARHVEKVNPGPKTLLERISVNTKDKFAQDKTNQTTKSTQREETEDGEQGQKTPNSNNRENN